MRAEARNLIRRLRFPLALALAASAVCAARAERILYEGRSAFGHPIVVEEDDRGLRTLMFEKYGARQSVVKPGDPEHLELPYIRSAMSGLALAGPVRRVLVVGLGGGSIPMFLRKHYPQATIDVVDIDPAVVQVAQKYMGFKPDAKMRAHTADGRRFIEQCRQPYDIIFLDAFGTDSIPYSLATVEFLRAVSRALTPRGVVVGNVWSSYSNPLYDSMVRTYQEVFPGFCIIRVMGAGNNILLALPRAEPITRAALARRCTALSKARRFRFDLGELVTLGYEPPPARNSRVRVLTDALRESRP